MSLNMNIATATVSEVPGVQSGPNECRPLEFFGICNLNSRNMYSGVFGVAEHEYRNGNSLRGTCSQNRPYERHPIEFFGIYNIISQNSLLGGFWGR